MYATQTKIDESSLEKCPVGQRWVSIFEHLKQKNIVNEEIKLIVEFSLCLLGLNAPTEISLSLDKKLNLIIGLYAKRFIST